MTSTMWNYRDPSMTTADLTGFAVQALDGRIGKVDQATTETESSYLVVDTGPWIFGKKVLLPAGVVDRVDIVDECVYVDRTKDEIKHAPELDDTRAVDKRYRDSYRDQLDMYYGPGGQGYRD